MYKGTYCKEKLSANRLLECYEIAPPRIKQYLEAEIQFVISNVHHADLVLELGCGYGRAMKRVSPFVAWIGGNDISKDSLELARSHIEGRENCSVFLMDASQMAFDSCTFDAVFCIQNGISAFGVDQKRLIAESIRVTKENGIILFSSYSPKIWEARLQWFKKQSELGLIGEIDEDKSSNGTIVCKDGFRATPITGNQLAELFHERGLKTSIIEVDESSIFAFALKTAARKIQTTTPEEQTLYHLSFKKRLSHQNMP
jgi:2-polyprenyl-6-hydroxyphenyl methylase/3-demethylubiquinone-9 3-methyltransferase